jgi:DNA segregation ATPase FtsK/SpoIIIE-like protein
MTALNKKYKYEESDGFMRLPSRRDHLKDQAYRDITLVKNESESGSSDKSDDSSDDDSDSISLTSHQRTIKDLEQQIVSNPSLIPTWLSLLSQTLSTVPHTSKNATKASSEIALSILSRALSSHPHNSTSSVLRLKYLKAGEEVWHESKLRAEWEDALKVGGMEIWMEWLEWRIRRAAKNINGIVEDAERVLRSLGDSNDDEIRKMRVIWRVAVMLQNAGVSPASVISTFGAEYFHSGYTERVTAIFQAQAEL